MHRHESLRTRIAVVENRPVQLSDATHECDLQVVDVSTLRFELRREAATRLCQEFFDLKIDLASGPLFGGLLVRLADDEHILILLVDHIIADGLSIEILNREIWANYIGMAKGVRRNPPPLPVQFSDYAAWLEHTRASWQSDHGSFWKEHLAGATGVRIPTEYQSACDDQPVAVLRHFDLGFELSTGLRKLSAHTGTQFSLVVLATYVALMSRWCGQRDLLIMTVAHGRLRRELAGMIGCLAGYIYMRAVLQPRITFIDLLKLLEEESRTVQLHHDYDRVPGFVAAPPTDLFFNWLPVHRKFQWLPVNRTLNWLPGTIASANASNESPTDTLLVEPFPLQKSAGSRFAPLFYESATGVQVALWYQPRLLSEASIDWFVKCLRSFASEFAAQPTMPIDSLRMDQPLQS